MTKLISDGFKYHEDISLFRDAVISTAREHDFRTSLVEKDYYCSLILAYLCKDSETSMVFKGGTALSKVYAGFYRLSEDLDFVIPVKTDSARRVRSKAAKPLKPIIDGIPNVFSNMLIKEPLVGHNNSKQYIAFVEYPSAVAERAEHIKIEIGLREEVERPVEQGTIRTLLRDPFKKTLVLPEFCIPVMAFHEAYAEKVRAALTRRKPAIRDFYDIFHAVKQLNLDVFEDQFIKLVAKKLAVPDNSSLDISPQRKELLKAQLGVELRSVLRQKDYEWFDLDESFEIVSAIAGKL